MRILAILGLPAAAAGCDLVFPPAALRGDAPAGSDGSSPDGAPDGRAVDGLPGPDASYACPSSYDPVPGAPSVYRFYDDLTWDEAIGECLNDQGSVPSGSDARTHLVVLDGPAEQAALYAAHPDDRLWIGLSDRVTEGAFLTVTTQSPAYPMMSSPPWGAGQPDDFGVGQDCVRILSISDFAPGELDDEACGVEHDVVCECDPFADDSAKY